MGPGSCVTALIAAGILSSNGSSISTKGNRMQALKVYRYVYPTCFRRGENVITSETDTFM